MALPNSANIGTTQFFTGTGDPNIDGILTGYKWNSLNLTYSFPNASADYGTGFGTKTGQYNYKGPFNGLAQLSPGQQSEVLRAFGLISSYTQLTFTPITESATNHAVLRLANSSWPKTSFSFEPVPSTGALAGDIFFGPSQQSSPAMGTQVSGDVILHEIGHTLGLEHGQQNAGTNQTNPFGYMNADKQDIEYSVMNYSSYIGQPLGSNPQYTEGPGSAPQTYMMYDIAALQYMYGANFSNVGKDVTYRWSSTTGQEFINGVSQGVPVTNPNNIGNIFETVWTGGANSTFNLSNFNDDATLDMRPGHYMMFSKAQRADLGYYQGANVTAGTYPNAGLHMAQGNVYNAWSNFQASDRQGCIDTRAYLPSYVEWLTCFDMNKVVREARQQQGRSMRTLTNPDGTTTMPSICNLQINMGCRYSRY